MPAYSPRETVGQGQGSPHAGRGDPTPAAGRYLCGVAARSTGPEHARPVPEVGRHLRLRGDLPKPHGSLRFQLDHGQVRPGDFGARRRAGEPAYRQAHGGGYCGLEGSRGPMGARGQDDGGSHGEDGDGAEARGYGRGRSR